MRQTSRVLWIVALLGCGQCAHAPIEIPQRSAQPAAGLLKQQRVAMGTQVSITLWASATPAAYDAIDATYAEMLRLEKLMTSWRHRDWPQSDVMRLNAQAGEPAFVVVAPETFAVLVLAQKIAAASGGAFDITYAPLRDVWHFDEDATQVIPDADAVARQRAYVGFADLELDAPSHSARLRRPGMRIDLGGIAKGAIVDAAVTSLRARCLQHFILQAGGDMYVSGRRDGRPWRVGIQDPSRVGDHFASLDLADHAFSTAGDYERGFVQDGRRYHHILDPKTGYPADASRSVTVYAPSALLADALDSTIFILGPQAGMAFLQQYPGCEAVIVDANDRVWVTPGLQARMQYVRP